MVTNRKCCPFDISRSRPRYIFVWCFCLVVLGGRFGCFWYNKGNDNKYSTNRGKKSFVLPLSRYMSSIYNKRNSDQFLSTNSFLVDYLKICIVVQVWLKCSRDV